MILMALDHVRDFFSDRLFLDATDLRTTTPANFLTRWVTHFCAPTFIFLAGTAAFLSGTRGKSTSELSWFLLTRGIWLAFFEVVVNRFLWMFNYDLHHHGAGVFWAIGWSMVSLSLLVHLPTRAVTVIGVAMILLHNLLDGLMPAEVPLPGWLWTILHNPGEQLPPSNADALKKFVTIGASLDVEVELIERKDYLRIEEYDALFIRETTSVSDHTYRFAKKAEREGLVVVDDPNSIIRCTNKVYLAERLLANKLPAPRTLILDRGNLAEADRALGFPLVLKIPDSSSPAASSRSRTRSSCWSRAGSCCSVRT